MQPVLSTIHENPVVSAFLTRRSLDAVSLDYLIHPSPAHQHDPFLLPGMSDFVEALHAVKGKRIAIMPDYDADGVLSGTLARVGLSLFGFGTAYVYPPKTWEGYGLSVKSVDAILAACPDVEVLLTTDNGSNAHEGVAYAKAKGLTVLVTDHHVADADPTADAVVNPNRRHVASEYPFNGISGTAVIYKTLQAYGMRYVTDVKVAEDFKSLLFLVGVSTISDVMPLLDENRYFVTETVRMLDHFVSTHTPVRVSVWDDTPLGAYYRGLDLLVSTLYIKGKLNYGVNVDTLGFTIAPILNSPRRMIGDSEMGFLLFQTTPADADYPVGERISDALFDVNEERKAYVTALKQELHAAVALGGRPVEQTIFTAHMKAGVAGLLAGAFTSEYELPSIAFAVGGKDPVDNPINAPLPRAGTVKGSGRAPDWFDLHGFLTVLDAEHPGLIATWGGHKTAAGISVYVDQFNAFKRLFTQRLTEVLHEMSELTKLKHGEALHVPRPRGEFLLDTPASMKLFPDVPVRHAITGHVMQDDALCSALTFFETVAPYGNSFEAPSFTVVFSHEDASAFRTMGKEGQHAKFTLQNGLTVIAWNEAELLTKLSTVDPDMRQFVVTGRLSFNEFNGRVSMQLVADDIKVINPHVLEALAIEVEQ